MPNEIKSEIPNHESQSLEEKWKLLKDTQVTAGEDVHG